MNKSRDETYGSDPKFGVYNELLQQILSVCSNKKITKYILKHKIDTNTYLQVSNEHYQPILYVVSKYAELGRLLKWILLNGGDPRKIPDVDSNTLVEMLFHCHPDYIDLLIEHGASFYRPILPQLRIVVLNNNQERISILIKKGVLHSEKIAGMFNILVSTHNIDRDLINITVKKLVIICQCSEHVEPLIIRNKVHKIMNDCAKTFYWLVKNGYYCENISIHEILQMAVTYYLVPVAKILVDHCKLDTKRIIIIHHKALDPYMVAAQRQIYNDGKYAKLCELCGKKIDRPTGGFVEVKKQYLTRLKKLKKLAS